MVVTTRTIRSNLKIIEDEFNKAMSQSSLLRGSVIAALQSKMAIMELGGWVEQTIDNILYYYVDKTISEGPIRETVKRDIIDTVYGFKYAREFKPLFQKIIGGARFEQIVRCLAKTGDDQRLFAVLDSLSKSRNRAAHTYWSRVTPRFDAPSTTITMLNEISPVLRKIWQQVRRYARAD